MKMLEKIIQTAGRDTLGNFAPEFAHYTVWGKLEQP